MALVIRNFEWQEDIDNFNFTEWCVANRGLASSYRVHYKLTLKGKFRKLFRIKKPNDNNITK
jgi:hypothetical protein